jgi:small subunit ribosomal protein S11
MVVKNKQKAKRLAKVSNGVVHICTNFNNVIITITDVYGNAIVACSSGQKGFRGAKKSTPFAAQVVSETAAKKAQDMYSLKTVSVVIKGPGAGRESAVRALVASGLIVTSIKDITPLPHNGCRARKRRRV